MPKIDKNSVFDVLINDRDEIMIAIDTRESEPEHPVLVIDGKNAVLVRNEKDSVLLADIPADLIDKLSAAEDVLVAEADGEGLTREYIAEVQKG